MFLGVCYFLQWNKPLGSFLYLSLFFLAYSFFLNDLLHDFSYDLYELTPKFLFLRQTFFYTVVLYVQLTSVYLLSFVSQAPKM